MSLEIIELQEAKHAYQQERKLSRNDYQFQKKYQRKYYSANRTKLNDYSQWLKRHDMDWLHLRLGNKCSWYNRTNQEIILEVDHVFPKLRIGLHNFTFAEEKIRDLENGEELRLLCTSCHKMRHSI